MRDRIHCLPKEIHETVRFMNVMRDRIHCPPGETHAPNRCMNAIARQFRSFVARDMRYTNRRVTISASNSRPPRRTRSA